MKQKLFSILALLLVAATGAWADTTVTWTASDLEETDLFINFEAGSAANNTIKGITVTASSGGNGAWQANNISMDEGSTKITFTSSVGNIKSIAITAQSIYTYGSTPSGWTMPGYTKLSWSGDASPTVSMTLSDWWEIYNISEIVFTIESAPAASTYSVTLAEGTEDADKWTIEPKTGLNGGETVTATYSGEKKVKSVKAVKKAPAPAPITVTINQSDWGWDSFTKGGVTVSAGSIDPMNGNLMNDGTFSTTLGNFTKIVVTAKDCNVSGTGWSGNNSSMTWAGTPASTVSFSGNVNGHSDTKTTIVCTIVPKN